MTFASKHVAHVIIGLGMMGGFVGFASAARAQVPAVQPGEADLNKKLRVQLDRTTIHAFEPVYLSLTAEQFSYGAEAEVQVQHAGGAWQPVTIDKKNWVKSDTAGTGQTLIHRLGVVLHTQQHAKELGAERTPYVWLFPEEGEYKIRAKLGPDSTTLTLTVAAPAPGEQEAWEAAAEVTGELINNAFGDPVSQGTIDTCAKVIRKYPKTQCAAYCQSYVSIAKFKIALEKFGRAGGKGAFESIAEELQKVAGNFQDGFFGELAIFYACYAKGLTKDFHGLLALSETMKTRATPWSDGVISMKYEVLLHTTPPVIPIDPDDPRATSQPSTKPAGVPAKP
jgi:hypothetical protein